MVRGDDELNFTMEEAAAWERPHVHRARHQRGYAADPGIGEGMGWGIIGAVFLLVLVILLAGTRNAQPNQSPTLAATAQTQPPRATNPDPRKVYVYDAGGYQAEIFFDGSPTLRVRGKLPPDVTLTRFVTEVALRDQPYDFGGATATAPANTIFIHSNRIFRAPSWRWVQSLDRTYSGYVCFPTQTASPAPNNPSHSSNASADAPAHEEPPSSQLPDAQYLARIRKVLELVDAEKSSQSFDEIPLPEDTAEALRVFEELANQLDKSQQEFLESLRDGRRDNRSRVVNTQ